MPVHAKLVRHYLLWLNSGAASVFEEIRAPVSVVCLGQDDPRAVVFRNKSDAYRFVFDAGTAR